MKEIPIVLHSVIQDLDENWSVEPVIQWESPYWMLITSLDDPDTGEQRQSSFVFRDDDVLCWRWSNRKVTGDQKFFRYEVNFPKCVLDEIYVWLKP